MKTISLKKVSAVAVASLGFGLLSVVPANAAVVGVAEIKVVEATESVAIGSAVASLFQIDPAANLANTNTVVITPVLTAKPEGSAVTIIKRTAASTSGADGSEVLANTGEAIDATTGAAADGSSVYTLTVGAGGHTDAGLVNAGTVGFTPDVAGTYVITLTSTAGDSDSVTAKSATYTVYAGFDADSARPNRAFMTQGASISNSTSAVAGGLAKVRVGFPNTSTDDYYSVSVTGGSLTNVSASGDIDKDTADTAGFNLANGANLAAGINFYVDSAADLGDWVDLQVTAATAGNVTITVTGFSSSTGIGTLYTQPVIAFSAALSTKATASTSKIYVINTHNNEALVSSTAPGVISKTAGTDAAAFTVTVNDGYGNPIDATDVVASVSGPGLINGGTGANTASGTPAARMFSATTNSVGKVSYNLDADGTAGVSTVTFTVGTTVLGSKTVTFYGSVAKYTATTILNATANGTGTTDAIVVCATDSAGIAVPSATIYATSGDSTIATVESSDTTVTTAATEDTDGPGTAVAEVDPTDYVAAKAVGCAGFTVTGVASNVTKDSVVITFRDASSAALAEVETTATIKLGSVQAATVALSTDKTSYKPGEKMTISLTWKDAYGRAIGAGIGTATLAAALTSSASLTGDALFAANNSNKLGVSAVTAYAPLSAGPLLLTGKTGADTTYLASAIRGLALSATVNVVDANQSAIITQIDALNAKIVALNALIAKIMKKLGVK